MKKVVTIFWGYGNKERVEKIGRLLKKHNIEIVAIPIDERDILELSSGGYIYTGKEIDGIEHFLEENDEKSPCVRF